MRSLFSRRPLVSSVRRYIMYFYILILNHLYFVIVRNPLATRLLDSGTTLLLIGSDAFKMYQNYTGAVFDNATAMLRLTPKQFNNLQSLYFTVGPMRDLMPFFIHLTIPHANELKPQTTFELTPNAQAWPRNLNDFIGGTNDSVYLIVGDIGPFGTPGLDFINGFTWLCVCVLSLSTCFPPSFYFSLTSRY